MTIAAAYVVLEWLDVTPPYPRYTFATVAHARELDGAVRWVEPCVSLDLAATLAARLNAPTSDPAREPSAERWTECHAGNAGR